MENILLKKQRLFTIGSEWLYFNIYIGPQTSNKFLILTLEPFTSKLIKKNVIDKWFFIRYKDETGLHLRIRFHLCNPKKGISKVTIGLNKLTTQYIEYNLISGITVNTYKREMERYGVDTIEEFESLFFINSKLILNILKFSETSEDNIWLFGIKGIDRLLNTCKYDLKRKKELLKELKTDFGKEFGINKYSKKQLSKKYRENKFKIESLFNDNNTKIDQYLDEFENESDIYISKILMKVKNNSDGFDIINDLLGSYIHMHCNRLFKSKQRLNEWVLYDLLYQYYNSKLARERIQLKKKLTL